MYLPLSIPPGLWSNGTEYEAKGRYRDASFWRFYEGSGRPIGPWRAKTASAVTGAARAIITWRDNSDVTHGAIGTHSKLYAMARDGTLYDITPAGFTSGRADAVAGGGYGFGNYGGGLYGVTTADSTLIQDASVWTLDTWGEDLVGVMGDDGIIYEWALNTGTPAAAVTNAPAAKAILVTEEEFLLALGASSDHRKIAWSDQADNTTWTAAATNQAGSFVLQTLGHIVCGKRVPGSHLIFTSTDVWRGAYQGPPLVYGYERIGSDCGIASVGAAVVAAGVCYWMGNNGTFWTYNGYVTAMASEVSDAVFQNFNALQISKVTCWHNSQFGEVWWHYPSAGSTENDSYVFYNYRENTWNHAIGVLTRQCGCDKGVLQYPLLVDDSGYTWEHEAPFLAGTYNSTEVSVTSGPIELGNGDRVMMVRQYIPDEATLGDVTLTIYAKERPMGAETTYGPYSATAQTPLRIMARQIRVKYKGASVDDFRVGIGRLDVTPAGMR